MVEIHRRPKVGRSVRVASEQLHHGIPAVVAGPVGIRGRMVRDPGLVAARALEEAVMSGAVVAVGAGEDAAVGLGPGRGAGRVRLAVPLEKPEAVVLRPAVARRVGDVRLAAEVERRRPLVDRVSVLLPRLIRLRDDVDRPRQRRVVGAQLLQADRLVRHPVEAREHHEVAVVVEPEHRAVDRPVGRQLPDVRIVIPRCRTTCESSALAHS